MARNLNDILADLPIERRKRVEARAAELASLKDLRLAVRQTQEQLAETLGVRQDTGEEQGRNTGAQGPISESPSDGAIEHLGKITGGKRHRTR